VSEKKTSWCNKIYLFEEIKEGKEKEAVPKTEN
jgi:hypothetical protein